MAGSILILLLSFRFPFPSGGYGEVRYVADELGYRPSSPLIPTPHPLPAHAIEQIRIAEDQRRRGITFHSRGVIVVVVEE
ncbi:Cuticle protein [Homarus americanus]|uniref:Cuticle protein n=1 Tax=Homarus americanus TaxID=6706 RepID=A0A8J5NC65_HOMAM|nr:Cuticle protein [Homarus americanus]